MKINGLLFATFIFHAQVFICRKTTTYSSSSTSKTNITYTSTETSTTAISNGTTTLCTSAVATTTASTTIGTLTTTSLSPTEYTAIGIGCIVVVAVVVLATACYCRRNKHPNSRTDIPINSGLYETHTETFSRDNYDHIIRITSGRENNMLDRVYSNQEPQYLTIEE